MTQAIITKSGRGFLSAVGRVAGAGLTAVNSSVSSYIAEAKDKAAARSVLEAKDLARVVAAERRFPDLLAELKAGYVPSVTQAQINSVSWGQPEPVARLLSRELDRIASELDRTVRAAGFPTEIKGGHLRRRMDDLFADALAEMHRSVFGGIDLPPYFAFFDGVLDYEMVDERQRGPHVFELYGRHSGHYYSYRPSL